jgi:hypothetical protein
LEVTVLALLVVLLLLALLFGGIGFSLHALWVIAVVCLVAAVVVFLVRGSGSRL